jgi:hypothetical protein
MAFRGSSDGGAGSFRKKRIIAADMPLILSDLED